MLNITSKIKVETKRCYWNLSRQANSTEQLIGRPASQTLTTAGDAGYRAIASFSFASMAHVTQWSNYLIISTGWDFDPTIKFNASTGEDYCDWFVSGVCGSEVAFDIRLFRKRGVRSAESKKNI